MQPNDPYYRNRSGEPPVYPPQQQGVQRPVVRQFDPMAGYGDGYPAVPVEVQGDTGETQHFSRKHGTLRSAFAMFQLFGAAILLALLINAKIFQSYEVFGQSMAPTLHQGDRLIINKTNKTWHELFGGRYLPERGDIIVFHDVNSDKQLVKRVIGLPGDRVVVNNGRMLVYNAENPDGFNPDEPYQENLQRFTPGNKDVIIGENQLFVSGDNRAPGASLDSRNDLGLVSVENVVGDLVLRLFPLSDAQTF